MHSLKYLRSATLHCKDTGIRKSEFVAKSHAVPQDKQLFLRAGHYGHFVFYPTFSNYFYMLYPQCPSPFSPPQPSLF